MTIIAFKKNSEVLHKRNKGLVSLFSGSGKGFNNNFQGQDIQEGNKKGKKKKEKKKKENSVKSDKEFISGMGVTRNLSITVSAETRTAQDKPLPKSDLIDGLLDLAFDFFNSAAKHDDRSS